MRFKNPLLNAGVIVVMVAAITAASSQIASAAEVDSLAALQTAVSAHDTETAGTEAANTAAADKAAADAAVAIVDGVQGIDGNSGITPSEGFTVAGLAPAADIASVQVGLPALGQSSPITAADGTVLYSNAAAPAEIALKRSTDSTRALVIIKNSTAAHEYRFPITLPAGARLVASADLLGAAYDTGEIVAIDAQGRALGIFNSAWARDAQGAAVPTSYRIDGSTIVQTVAFDENTAFPVVADPEWLQIIKCAGAISLALGSAIVPGGAIVRFISKVGSISKAAKIFVRALKVAKPAAKQLAIRNLLLSVGGALTGITLIVEQCSF